MGKVRRSLRHSFLDGTFYSLMFGFGDTYISPFAVALNASPQEIGLLISIPQLASSLTQYKSADIIRAIGRKRTMLTGVFLHGLTWLPILLIPWVFAGHRPLWLVLFATLYAVFMAVVTPAWFSIMSQYIPSAKRGEYFSFRGKWLNGILLLASFAGGLFLWLTRGLGLLSFSILFAAAFVCRMLSLWFLSRQYEPPLAAVKEDEFTFRDFLTRAGESNFVRFVFFSAFFSFATYLAAPFFPVLMLRDLKWGYFTYVSVNTTLSLFTLLAVTSWGRHADRIGNISVLRATGLVVSFIPALWAVSTWKPYILAVNALAGFGWAGFNLCLSNFIYDAVSPGKRVRCFAYFTLVNGMGICLGSLAGGYLIPHLPAFRGSRILTVCILSSMLRLAVWAGMLPRIREVRPVAPVRQRDLLFSVIGLRDIEGVSRGPQTMKE